MTIMHKDEEQWWTASNAAGQVGAIPVPYVEVIEDGFPRPTITPPAPIVNEENNGTTSPADQLSKTADSAMEHSSPPSSHHSFPPLPAPARAIKMFSKPYDESMLTFQVIQKFLCLAH